MRGFGKRISILLLTMALLTALPGAAWAAGFVQTQQGTVYVTDKGKNLTGLQKIGKRVYLFSNQGLLLTGLQKIGSKLYFFDPQTGVRKYGWIHYSGKSYYAHKKTGALFVNRYKGKRFLGPDGAYVKGAGKSALAGWVKKSGHTYYYKGDGTKAVGLTDIEGRLYYFNKRGILQKNKAVKAGGSRYYIGSKGYALTNRFVTVKGKKCYVQADGTFATGLVRIGKSLYYFNRKGRLGEKGFVSYGGARYLLTKKGKVYTNRWVKYKKKVYWADPDGKIATDRYIGAYYVGTDGVRVKQGRSASGLVKRGGKVYFYDKYGNPMCSQWVTSSDQKRYYLGTDGSAVVGLQTIGGLRYYFDESGVLQTDSIVVVGKTCYKVDPADGHILSKSAFSGSAIVSYAKRFVGNPYVYGGTSLTNGADCSGFTQSVLLHFGIKIMRVAQDQKQGASGNYARLGYAVGTKVSDANLLPGDLVFYGSGSYASHVAIYMGDGKVVHAANSRVGIIVSSIDYVRNRLHNQNRRYWA